MIFGQKNKSGSFTNYCNDIWICFLPNFFCRKKCCKIKISICKVSPPSLLKHSVGHFEDIRMIFGHVFFPIFFVGKKVPKNAKQINSQNKYFEHNGETQEKCHV